MVLRTGTPNLSNAFYRKGRGLRSRGNILYRMPYRGYQTNIYGHEGGSIWSSIGSLFSKAAAFAPRIVHFVKPIADVASPVFNAVSSIRAAANQAEQLRLMRELALKNFDSRLSAERKAAKASEAATKASESTLTPAQKEKVAQIIATGTLSVITSGQPVAPVAAPPIVASGSGCRRRKLGSGFRNF